jgi:hypothetical protein
MMQELETKGPPKVSEGGMVTGRSFSVLFALAGSVREVDAKSLGLRLEMNEVECRNVLGNLNRQYLVDFVSGLEGKSVRETLRLTEEGKAILLQSLEMMCELPERH